MNRRKDNIFPEHYAMKTGGSGCIALRILDLNTSWRLVVIYMPRPLYLPGMSSRYSLDRRLGGPQSWSGRRYQYADTEQKIFNHLF
jgi:hypothetical protein